MQPQTTLIGAKSRVELHTVSAVDLQVAFIVLPDDTELNDALGDRNNLESRLVLRVLLEEGTVLESRDKLCECKTVSKQSPENNTRTSISMVITYPCGLVRTRVQREGQALWRLVAKFRDLTSVNWSSSRL